MCSTLPEEKPLDPEDYEPDEDGFPREIVGSWAPAKYRRLERYVGISRSVRKGFIGPGDAGATFIDLFSGPARVRIKGTQDVRPGSPLVAWLESKRDLAPFTEVHVADADPRLISAADARLRREDAPVLSAEFGPAAEIVDRIVARLNPYALHVAFLDPYNLRALPFDVIRKLATLERMDILVHVSIQDLQRNLRLYIAEGQGSPLDTFAPGWRYKVDTTRPDNLVRAKLYEHWRNLIADLGMGTAEVAEKVSGPQNQPLYWLAFAARHQRALEFWEKIRDIEGEGQLPLI
jgi:three-Cys-motif partner protein